ncbi:MAG TPA: HAMP domain-containing sensor histidine kinase [Usitatibacter sp.]|nr:HAMP domain-containing sensor histidine kinase [Usitatibacter sp.]
MKVLEQLSTTLLQESDALLAQWRAKVREFPAARKLDVPALNDHIPVLIRELAEALRLSEPGDVVDDSVRTPAAHGTQRFEDGFDIEQVVAEYNILRGCVHELADRHGFFMQGRAFQVVNDVLDGAIGAAVKTFAASQAMQIQRRREEYLAFVAHDLRTPLSAISLSTHILEQRLTGSTTDPDTARVLNTLRRNVRHLDTLVGNVIKENTHLLTELGIKLERRTFDLWPLVEGVMQDLQPMARDHATRLVNEVPDELELNADAGLIRRILQNLLANAITYTPSGTVTVGARLDEPAEALECWIRDDGKGIEPARIGRVFDALETDPKGNGIGLGLAIVKTFVEAHHGKAWVDSIEGKGSTFRFTLPQRAALPE